VTLIREPRECSIRDRLILMKQDSYVLHTPALLDKTEFALFRESYLYSQFKIPQPRSSGGVL